MGNQEARKSRGGHGLFEWEKIKDDKYAGNYLGASLKAATGRWASNRDLEWFSKPSDKHEHSQSNLSQEMAEIKRLEAEAFAQALGVARPKTSLTQSSVSQAELKRVIHAEAAMDSGPVGLEGETAGVGFGHRDPTASTNVDLQKDISLSLQRPSQAVGETLTHKVPVTSIAIPLSIPSQDEQDSHKHKKHIKKEKKKKSKKKKHRKSRHRSSSPSNSSTDSERDASRSDRRRSSRSPERRHQGHGKDAARGRKEERHYKQEEKRRHSRARERSLSPETSSHRRYEDHSYRRRERDRK